MINEHAWEEENHLTRKNTLERNAYSLSLMARNQQDVAYEFLNLLRVYKDGHVERLIGTDVVPPPADPQSPVFSKDIIIIPKHKISARLYLPSIAGGFNRRLPILLYFHGGAFCVSSPFTHNYHNYLNSLLVKAQIIAISVNYRKAPENPLPAAYEDSWAALQWVASHRNGDGPEVWLNRYSDFDRVFLAGESAGANIAHNLSMRVGSDSRRSLRILGVCLVHPYFWGSDPIGSEGLCPDRKSSVDKLWPFICPSAPDNDDPRVNPMAEGARSLTELGCRRVLVCVAERDIMRDRGWLYYETLGRSGWTGVVEIEETEGEDHGFHLYNLGSVKAQYLISRLADFYNRDMHPPSKCPLPIRTSSD